MNDRRNIVFAACRGTDRGSCFHPRPATMQVSKPEAESGAVVCLPGVFFSVPDDCLAAGPSVLLTELADTRTYSSSQPTSGIKTRPGAERSAFQVLPRDF